MKLKTSIITVCCMCFAFFASAEDCKFGLILPFSGDYAKLGDLCNSGIAVAKEARPKKDYQVEYVLGDSKGLAKDAVSEFKKMAEVDKIQAAMIVRAPCGMAVNPLSLEKKIPLLGLVAQEDFVTKNPYAYRFWSRVKQDAKVLAEQAIRDGNKKIILISSSDEWLLFLGPAFEENYKNLGGQIVYADTILPDFQDFRAFITKFRSMDADGIFLNVALGQIGTFVKQIRESGLNHKLYSTFWASAPDVIKTAGYHNLSGLTFVDIDSRQPVFAQKIKELFPEQDPTSAAYACYAAVAMLEDGCAAKQKSSEDFQSIFQKLAQVNTLDGGIKITNREAEFGVSVKTFSQESIIQK